MKAILTLSLALTLGTLISQDFPRHEVDLQQIIDDLYGYQEEALNYEALYENLLQLRAHPQNLNTMSAAELQALHVLTPIQIKQLLNYRDTAGSFVSIYELQAIPTFDLDMIYRLVPFVFVPDPSTLISPSLWMRMKAEGDHYVLLRFGSRLQQKTGFQEPDSSKQFKGSPEKISIRFRSSRPGDFSVGFSLEKDEGERLHWSPRQKQYGFDYGSFHLQLINKGKLKNIIVGDFQAQFGQGLILGGGFGMGKGGETITGIRKSNTGLLPYTSFYEAGAFRGGALTTAVTKKISVTNFIAFNRRDARIADNEETSYATTLQTTGLHRNENEISMRRKSMETNGGLIIQFNHHTLEAGLIAHYLHYDKPLIRNPTSYNQFSFSGKENLNLGCFLNYARDNISFFSEVAKSSSGGIGMIAGILGSLHPTFDVALAGRLYQRDYYPLYGNALSENTISQNERAVYWGWKYRMNRRWTASGYTDLFIFPWIKFRNYRPSNGSEWLARIDFTPSRKVRMSTQFRQEEKTRNASEEHTLYVISPTRKQNFVLSTEFGVGQKLRFKTRVQGSNFKIENRYSHGFSLSQDLNFELGRFEFSGRYVVFEADDFDNRQYCYEKDVWLAYSLPSYYGRGVRHCAMIEYKITRAISLWIRYTQTRYTDRDEIGSGLDTIKGDLASDVKFQVRMKF